MERVDVVICGAEAVVESGAVVSQLGTYSMAIAAHVHKVNLLVARLLD